VRPYAHLAYCPSSPAPRSAVVDVAEEVSVPGTDPVASLAQWVTDLEASVRGARRRRIVAIGSISATVLMLTTVGVALATDEHRDRVPHPVAASSDPSWVVREESGAPVVEVTPAAQPGGLTVSARSDTDLVSPGQDYRVTVTWRDEDGRLLAFRRDWGDGAKATDSQPDKCVETAGVSGATSTFRHSWSTPGTYLVRFTVTTATCDGRTEAGSVSFPVRVVAVVAPGRPAPAPAPGAPAPAPPAPAPPPPPAPSPTAASPSAPAPSPTPSPIPTSAPVPTTTPTGPPPPTSSGYLPDL
jgi:hypothetical protein